MNVIQRIINKIIPEKEGYLYRDTLQGLYPDMHEDRMNFADVLFSNICDLLTDLTNDVTLVNKGNSKDTVVFAEFKAFFDRSGKIILNRLFKDGFVVIAYSNTFKALNANEYTIANDGQILARDKNKNKEIYVMKSDTFLNHSVSDKAILFPFLKFIDNAFNASNTASARLGAFIVMTPETAANAPVATILRKEDKEDLEKDMSLEYGGLSKQKQVMILPRPMNTAIISLAAIDQRTSDKVKMATLVIADRIKVPANQIAFIDAMSSKSFANGSETREGDFSKYQSFERLLNGTFIRFAEAIGLQVDYAIYNKPERESEIQTTLPNESN